MNDLSQIVHEKQSFLCIGLDTDLQKIPECLRYDSNPILKFNQEMIAATQSYAAAYKINIAFYECLGKKGWEILEKTLEAIPSTCYTIADAKRGDIENTSRMYAKTFFETYDFDSITVTPYMGEDSVAPFLEYENKRVFVLALTSNKGALDFQQMSENQEKLYEKVIRKSLDWAKGAKGTVGFVVGATRGEEVKRVRELAPNEWLLVPGVGAQGGSLDDVCKYGKNKEGGVLINSSRAILYASNGTDFAAVAAHEAKKLQTEIAARF